MNQLDDAERHQRVREILRDARSVNMYHAEADRIVTEWQWFGAAGSSLVVILRGVPGSGKSTLAAQIRMIAQSMAMTAEICSADAFFTTDEGYHWDRDRLPLAHEFCMNWAVSALRRGVDFVIVDNTNCRLGEWEPYEQLTYERNGNQFYHLHGICRVNFTCQTEQEAHRLARRAKSAIPATTIFNRFEDFARDDRFFHPHYTMAPIVNTWSDVMGPPTAVWDQGRAARAAPLQWSTVADPERMDPRTWMGIPV